MEPKSVLRYWLEAVRHEEALLARPRARRPRKDRAIDLASPGIGQAYFRLGPEHAGFFLLERPELTVPLDGAILSFLEHTLRNRYRSEARRERAREEQWLLGWPVLYFAGREELAPLFRAPVALSWRSGDEPWMLPSHDSRSSGHLPDAISLEHDTPALSLDAGLANRELGIVDEDLEELSARWERARPSAVMMVRDLLAILDPQLEASRLEGRALFSALARAAAARARNASVHAVGIIQDAGVMAPTHHLQRELAALLTDDAPVTAALTAYLTGRPAGPSGWKPLMGRRHARGLTESQRGAAEAFLGSTLTAVQGPPGTGKTELILDLAAHAVVARAERFERTGVMTEELLVVSSTNNRAVDNVLDPLASDRTRLPIGLRAGNQEVTASLTVGGLSAAREWLAAQSDQDAKARLDAALEKLREARSDWEQALGPERERRDRSKRHAKLLAELRTLVDVRPLSTEERALLTQGSRLIRLLDDLEELMLEGGRKLVHRLERRWERDAERSRELVSFAAIRLPPEERTIDDWEDALLDARAAAERALQPLRLRASAERDLGRKQRLESEVLALESKRDAPIDQPSIEASAHSFYMAALEVREAWAVANRSDLIGSLDAAVALCSEHRSLRRALSDEKSKRWLRRLFPVLGSTLLSLGNLFSTNHHIAQLVIDEAGQCHPAHAVSGLLRATRALVIGDVHQLPPVVQLSTTDEELVLRRSVKRPSQALDPYRVGATFTPSAQSLADRAVDLRHELVDHFRCQPEIIGICDRLCGYRLQIHTPRRSLGAPMLLSSPVLFHAVAGRQEAQHGSWRNRYEVEAIAALVDALSMSDVAWKDLAILTPYVAQLEDLRRELRRSGVVIDAEDGVATGTIHRFQGGERTVVILSTVVTEARSLPFLDERVHLLNVAISRARDHLVVVGHAPTLLRGARTRVMIEAAEKLSWFSGLDSRAV